MDSAFFTALIETTAGVLLHSLWQGAVVGLLYALTMLYLRDSTPRLRYAAAVFWLVVLAVCPVLTTLVIVAPGSTGVGLPGSAAFVLPSFAARDVAWAAHFAPLWVALWFAGVMMLSVRLLWNWRRAQRLTHLGCQPLGSDWEQRLAVLARQIGVSRPVQLVESVVVSVPTVIGWLKPVILLPSSALLGLTRRQLELVIAHELAHIVRYDYGVNYLLVLVETLWFHHPAVHLIGRGIREERELCCDDLVISRCGSRYEYVTALTDLETLRSQHLLDQPLSNLAATGGDLLHRVQRIVKGHAPRPGSARFGGVAVVLTVLLGAVLLYAPAPQTPEPATVPVIQLAVTPSSFRVRPIETLVTGTSLNDPAAWIADSRSMALIGTPPAVTAPAIARVSNQSPRIAPSPRDWVSSPPPRPTPSPVLASLDGVTVVPEPERAGPTRAMMNELDLASPMLESLSDLRMDASRALAASGPSYAAPEEDDLTDGGDLVVADVVTDTVREEGGQLVKRIEPRYPSRARLRGYTDTVQIEFVVTDTGEVGDIVVTSAQSKRAFERAVVSAVRKWRYEPLLRDGVPVERRVVETFAFRLGGPNDTVKGAGCRRDKNNRFTCNTPGLSRILAGRTM
ncbi:MAG: M56 family metallopeptidase [Pseudomonadota bacterium]